MSTEYGADQIQMLKKTRYVHRQHFIKRLAPFGI